MGSGEQILIDYNYNQEKEINELKTLRAELLSQYEEFQEDNKLSQKESILLQQTLLENYDGDNFDRYIDNDDCNDSDQSEVFVKKMTQGRNL